MALYLAADNGMRLVASKTSQPIGFGAPTEMPSAVLRVVQRAPTLVIAADDIERTTGAGSANAETDAALRDFDWAFVAPIGAQGTLVGVLVIGRKLSGDQFSV